MTTINKNEIRNEIVTLGLITKDALLKCNHFAIHISGEYDRNDNITNIKTTVGIYGEDVFFKGLPMSIDLPEFEVMEDLDEAEKSFKNDIQEMYPDFKIFLRID